MNEVIFWGTRGSLPVALTYRDIREKIIGALIAANGKTFKNHAALDQFVDTLPFAISGTFGGNSACVEIVGDGPEHFICDMGSGARPPARPGQDGAVRRGKSADLSHLHFPSALG